ncbi:MAG: group 1 truncated hemoglobin [Gemmatimonadota bacterium]
MTQDHDSNRASPSLWERLGGEAGTDALLHAFYDRVLADPELAPFFQGVAMERLRNMQREFFSAALGGPIQYRGRPLAHAHHGRGIQPTHLRRFVQHLFDTLETIELSQEDREAIYDRIHRQADDVLGQSRGMSG